LQQTAWAGQVPSPWILQPLLIFIGLIAVNWVSKITKVSQIKLDFEGFLFVHIGHFIFGLLFSLLIWFKTWIVLKYIGKTTSKTSMLTAWSNTPYLLITIILFMILTILRLSSPAMNTGTVGNTPLILVTQKGFALILIGYIVADIWSIYLSYIAVSIVNPLKSKAVFIGAIAVFLTIKLLGFLT